MPTGEGDGTLAGGTAGGHRPQLLSVLPCHEVRLPVHALGRDLQSCFAEHPELPGVIITEEDGAIAGLVSRRRFMELFSKPYRMELYSERRLNHLLREMPSAPLVFDADTEIDVGAAAVVARPAMDFTEPVVIAGAGGYRVVDSQTLLAALAENYAQQYRELQAAKDAIVEVEKLASLGSLVAGIAHEINTPLGIGITAVSTAGDILHRLASEIDAKTLRRSELSNAIREVDELGGVALSNLKRAASLVRSFKQVAADQVSEQRREFRLGEELRNVQVSLEPMARREGVSIRLDGGGEVAMNSYPGAIFQVVSNLVVNSLHHAYDPGKGGVVEIGFGEAGRGRAAIRVRDEGKGVPEVHRDHVFEPFFTTRRGNGGTGLGLAIVHNLIRGTLGGSIVLERTAGPGASFLIDIPCTAPLQPPRGGVA